MSKKSTRKRRLTKSNKTDEKRPLKSYEIDYNVIDINAYVSHQSKLIEQLFSEIAENNGIEILSIEELTDEDFNYFMAAEVEDSTDFVFSFDNDDIPNDNEPK